MAFTPRTFPEILNDMIVYVQQRTPLTDFTPGSIIRTILESSALEDDEQYFQMVQLLDLFAIADATGDDLDRRLADYRLYRLPAQRAFGRVQIADNSVKTTQVAIDAATGALILTVVDSTPFPVSGFPYTIRIGEGTPVVQDVDVSANNTAGGVLTLDATTPLTDDTAVGHTVTLVTGAVSRLITAGTEVEAPATAITPTKKYDLQESASIVAGNILSNAVRVKAINAGSLGNTGTQTVTKFTGGPPFSGATVLNAAPIEGGEPIEGDDAFRERGLAKLQSLSRGTPLALKTEATGITDVTTGQRTESANIVEDYVNNLVLVYVDDGTGLIPDTASTGSGALDNAVLIGDSSLDLVDAASLPSRGFVLVEDDTAGVGVAELLEYKERQNNLLVLADGVTTTSTHDAGTIVTRVDVLSASAEANQRRFRLKNYPVLPVNVRIFQKPLIGPWVQLTEGADFILNHGIGDMQLVSPGGVAAGTQLVAGYQYYTNLVALVQRVLEGDPNDPVNFPGVKASGVFLRVLPPQAVRVTVRASLTAEANFVEADLAAPVRRAIEDYINSRKIGEDIILTKIVDVAHNVAGVRDIVITQPLVNQVILEDQLPVAQDVAGNSTVFVV